MCFIVPGLIIILALSVLFLAHSPPTWVEGAAAGAGAAVPAVAVGAAIGLAPASWRRAGRATPAAAAPAATGAPPAPGVGETSATGPAATTGGPETGRSGRRPAAATTGGAPATPASALTAARIRWACYLLAGGVAANLAGEFLVAVLLACGLLEWLISRRPGRPGCAACDRRAP